MTTQEKLIRQKLILLELGEYLNNVSRACRINGVSIQHFYDIKKAYEKHGLEGLKEKTRHMMPNSSAAGLYTKGRIYFKGGFDGNPI